MYELNPDEAIGRAQQLFETATDAYAEHMAAGDETSALGDLDELVRGLAEILSAIGAESPTYPEITLLMTFAHQERWMLTEDPASLDAVITYTRAGLSRCGDPGVALELRVALAFALAEAPGPGRDEAVEIFTGVLPELAADDSRMPGITGLLGRLRYQRFLDRGPAEKSGPGAVEDLDAAIALLTAAAWAWAPAHADGRGALADRDGTVSPHEEETAPPDDEDDYPVTLWGLVLALSDRLDARDDAADADALIYWGERFTALPGVDVGDAAGVHELVAGALVDRAEARPETRQADLDASIRYYQAALAAGPEDLDRADLYAFLANACWLRLNGDDSDHAAVDEMTGYAEQAWRLLPAGDPAREAARIETGLYLSTGIFERQRRPTEPFDPAAVNLAIDVLTEIEPELAAGHELHMMAIVILGTMLIGRGQATGSMADIAAAQPWLLRAARELPVHDPQWAETAQTLAASMFGLAAAGLTGPLLDQAIDLLAIVVDRPNPELHVRVLTSAGYGMALLQRAGSTGGRADLDEGIRRLRQAYDLTPDKDVNRLHIAWNLGSALLTRFYQRGSREDLDAAEYYCEMMSPPDAATEAALRLQVVHPDVVIAALRGMVKATRGAGGNVALLDEAVEHFRTALALISPGHPYYDRIQGDLGLALMMRGGFRGAAAGDLAESAAALDAAAAALPAGHIMKPLTLLRAGGVRAVAGQASGSADLLREAVSRLRTGIDALDPRSRERARFAALLGLVYNALHQITSSRADLDAAARWLAAACDLGREHEHPLLATILTHLAHAYHRQGRIAQASETGLAGLRERGRDVLLQTGTAHALSGASAAAAEAAEIAHWCLDDGHPDTAIEALELGRGLVLHAATSVAELPEMLDAAGRSDLAHRWREAATGTVAPDTPWHGAMADAGHAERLLTGAVALEMPDDLRAQALAALAGTITERLLAPPGPDQIAAALAETGADALVYLLGPRATATGQAIVIRASGPGKPVPEMVQLPLLDASTDAALDGYLAAQAETLASASRGGEGSSPGLSPDGGPAVERWRDALRALCEWAWPAVMRPLLDHVQQWRLGHPPRLVLVPAGRLNMVPWHAAAWRSGETGPRYACQDAVVSYAASGRQLIDLGRRPALPLRQSPVLLGNPTLRLWFAAQEAQAIHDACYPEGAYFGYVGPLWDGRAAGPGTGQDVLRQLPSASNAGASMIHLGCHANVVAGALGESFLSLANSEKLTIEDILRRANGRVRTAPGGLVSLAACLSDLAAHEYDEALTLSTAFLAAGAVTVVGARWELPDEESSLQMFMFHHFMTADGHSPRDALRLAQLWMLDPHRRPPLEMPAVLASRAGNPGLGEVSVWGALTHQGR
jgi:tetratricopeptide (TPR) repeat protein